MRLENGTAMHALSIEIQNFRRFERFSCEFHPRFTLLMGPNGSGKSSLLRAVHACLGPLYEAATGHSLERVNQGDARKVHSVDPANEAWRNPVFPCRGRLLIDFHGEELPLGFEVASGDSKSFVSGIVPRDAIAGHQLVKKRAAAWFDPDTLQAAPIIARYAAINPRSSGQAVFLRKPFETKQDIWKLSANESVDIDSLARWFQYNELRALQEGKPPLVYRLTKQAVLSAIHAQDIKYVVRDSQLMLLHENQGWRPFDELSDGQRRIAAIFCDLALRCASLNSQLAENCIVETPGIVTIDELDLHLHPAWQRTLIGDLLRVFPKLQFIATSHSPFLLQAAFELGAVVDMETGEFAQATDTSIEDITEAVMGVEQPQRSARFLDLKDKAARYMELLESRPSSPDEIASVKAELDQLLSVFANDPASAAWLEQRRVAAGV